MIYKLGCVIATLFLAGTMYGAEIDKTLSKNVERAVVNAAKSYYLYPRLSKEKLDAIPALLTKAKMHARKELGLTDITEEDVVANLHFYLGGGYNPLEDYATLDEDIAFAAQFSKQDLEHALHYALAIILDEKYRTFLEPQLYPAVKDWDAFYVLCQAFADEFYDVLSEELATGNKSVMEEVFLNDPD